MESMRLPPPRRLPLQDSRVLSLTLGAAGPMTANALGYFGAEVVHVESRMRPDGHRGGNDPNAWDKTPFFVKIHRNFQSATINFNTKSGLDLVKQLVQVSDVVIENFSLGVLPRLGLDYPNIRKIRPDIVMASLRGYGSTGPWASYASWGPNLGAMLGISYLWNYPDAETPTAEARSQHPDFLSGVCGAFAVMAALIHRRKTGEGQWIDLSQAEVGSMTLAPIFLDTLVNHRESRPRGNRHWGSGFQGVYPCAGEDQWCAISIETEAQWNAFCEALGRPDWARGVTLAMVASSPARQAEIDRGVRRWTQSLTKYDVMARLQSCKIPAAAVQDVEDEVKRDPQYRSRNFFVEMEELEMGKVAAERLPILLSKTPGSFRTSTPFFGEHTRVGCQALLGKDDGQFTELQAEKALY